MKVIPLIMSSLAFLTMVSVFVLAMFKVYPSELKWIYIIVPLFTAAALIITIWFVIKYEGFNWQYVTSIILSLLVLAITPYRLGGDIMVSGVRSLWINPLGILLIGLLIFINLYLMPRMQRKNLEKKKLILVFDIIISLVMIMLFFIYEVTITTVIS